MENLSDDDFRSYISDFQSYLHNISEIGPIEPSSSSSASAPGVPLSPSADLITDEAAAAAAAVDSSPVNWSAMSNRVTGIVQDEEPPELDEDDEDRIIAEGCELDCGIKDPDLIPIQTHSDWYPDVTRDEDKEENHSLEDGSSVDPCGVDKHEEQPHSPDDQDWQVETLKPSNRNHSTGFEEDWQYETLKPSSRGGGGDGEGATGIEVNPDQGPDVITGDLIMCSEEDQSSPAVEQKTSWKYFGDDQTLQSYEQTDAHKRQKHEPDMMTSDEDMSGEAPDVTSVGHMEPNPSTTWEASRGLENNEGLEEDLGEDLSSDEDHFALDRSQSATLVKSNRASVIHDETPAPYEALPSDVLVDLAQQKEEFEPSRLEQDSQISSEYYQNISPEAEIHTGTVHQDEEETQEPHYDDRLNNFGAKSEGKQNAAHLVIYPSQVRKTSNIFPAQTSDTSDERLRHNGCDDKGSGENDTEDGERDLPEQGSVKTLLAQWRQLEQQKKRSEGTPDQELRMRSQSCDPLSSRKNNRLSPNDDDVPQVGARVGRGRSRGAKKEEDDEDEEGDDHYRSQPSLTKAIMAKFENLDLQAANNTAKPKTSKDFKWQVKETTRFCRPGFQPRSGR